MKVISISVGLILAGGLMAPATAMAETSAKPVASEAGAKPRTIYKRSYHAGNKYGQSRGTLSVTYDKGSYRNPFRIHVSGRLWDNCGTKSTSYAYLSWYQGHKGNMKKHNKLVATAKNCKNVGVRKSYGTGIFRPDKAYVSVCTKVKKRWYCGKPG